MLASVTIFESVALLLTLAALFSYFNFRFLKLPTTIGVMMMALALSLALIAAGWRAPAVTDYARGVLDTIDFNEALLHGMLGFLLFAGALHINLDDLLANKTVIGLLATVGVVLSTFIVAGLSWVIFNTLLNLDLPWIYCLLFGALISPTDPIAVLAILKRLSVPKSLETKVTGESLFNAGVGVVAFLAIMKITQGSVVHGTAQPVDTGLLDVLWLFLFEVVGGAVCGLVAGVIAYRMLKQVDNYQVEVLISLALVAGGYALCDRLHLSGPIAMVVAGLLIGNHGRTMAMSDETREHLDAFWELVDEILNAVLFVLIGLEVMVLTLTGDFLLAGLLAIPAVLLARLLAVGLPVMLMRRVRTFTPHAVKVLTWGGLRGGISVALALSIPKGAGVAEAGWRDLILAVTYVVVVFSIGVQGLTIGPLLRRWKLVPGRAGMV